MKNQSSTMLVAMGERFIPLVLAVVIVIATFMFRFDLYNIKDYKFVYSNIISFSSIIIGFLITMVSILVTFTGKRVMKLIKNNNAEDLLKSYFTFSLASGIGVALLSICLGVIFDDFSIIGFIVKTESFRVFTRIVSNIWVFLFIYFMSATVRVFYIMLKILRSVIDEESSIDVKRTEADATQLNLASLNKK